MKEKKARVEDAMHATKAAVEEGIVPGGGVALLRGVRALESLGVDGDQQVGVNIIKRALEEPMRWIVQNAGHEGSIVVQRVREAKTWTKRGSMLRLRATRTWSRLGLSTPPRSFARLSRTPARSQHCCSRPRPSCQRFRRKTRLPRPLVVRPEWEGCTRGRR